MGQCQLSPDSAVWVVLHAGSVVWSVAFSRHGRKIIACGTAEDEKNVLDETDYRIMRDLRGHDNAVGSIALKKDGIRVVSGLEDKSVRIWNVSSGKCEESLVRDDGGVLSVLVCGDGPRAVSGSSDRSVRI